MINFIAGFGLLAWAYLAFFHRSFWRGNQRLTVGANDILSWPAVTAIVPARDEAATIGKCVNTLRAQIYPGRFSIVIVDDGSRDGTADLARLAAAGTPGAAKVEILTAPPLPRGWTGKLAALNTGVAHASTQSEAPEFLWFTDADVIHGPSTLTRLVSKALTDRRDLVSLMVRLHCESPWEHLLIPAFIYFFQMLYPFPAVNDPHAATAAAAGGCVLVRRERLEAAGGLAAIRGEIIDDCALGRIVKRADGRLWLGLADDSHSLRAADDLAPLWSMVARTAFTQLGYSTPLLIGTVLAMGLIFLGPALVVLTFFWHFHFIATLEGLAAVALMAWTALPTLRDYGRSDWEGLLLPLAGGFYIAMTIDSAVAHWRHRGGQWKDRHYGPSSPTENLLESP